MTTSLAIVRISRGAVLLACFCTLPAVTGCAHLGLQGMRAESTAPVNGDIPGSFAGQDVPVQLSPGVASPVFPTSRLVSQKSAQTNVPPNRRMVVYTSNYRIVVPEIEPALQEARQLAESFGGYVQLIDGPAITIRVPVEQHQLACDRIETLGDVSYRKLEATDVTEEYVDLKARLRNAKAVRTRLEALLERAEDVKAAIGVEKELNRVGEQIERFEAKLELLKNKVALASITVTFTSVARSTDGLVRQTRLPFRWLRGLNPKHLLQTN